MVERLCGNGAVDTLYTDKFRTRAVAHVTAGLATRATKFKLMLIDFVAL